MRRCCSAVRDIRPDVICSVFNHRIRRALKAAATVFMLMGGTATATATPTDLHALRAYDRQIAQIGYRLAASGGDLCRETVPLSGFALHDLSQYARDEQSGARAVFGFGDAPLVLAVASTSPAAAAGLREGDALLAIDGVDVPPAKPGAQRSYVRMAEVLRTLNAASQDGVLDLQVRRAGETLTIQAATTPGCRGFFQVKVSTTIDSRADGTFVEINSGLIDFAGTEEQVAAIVAHELAHNILNHRARLNEVHIRRGVLGQFGRSARLVRQTEEEADRLSVYLLDRAGYAPEAIISFWQHYRSAHILSFLRAHTHPSESDRILLVSQEIARIVQMKAAGLVPRPAFMTGPSLPKLL